MNIAIYGLGLIGGSIGRAITKKTRHKCFGFDIDCKTVEKAKLLSAIEDKVDDANIADMDLIVLALCPKTAIKTMNEILHRLKSGAVVIDCCGNKKEITEAMEKAKSKRADVEFVAVHPMAGREFSGISHSMATLFEHSYFIVTPTQNTKIETMAMLKQLFLDMGADGVEIANAEKHDEMISYTSQLAHVISNAYIRNQLSAEHAGFSAGSFRDMTRVSKINSEMWTELFLENSGNLLEQIEVFEKNLKELKIAIQSQDKQTLKSLLQSGNDMKQIAENARREKRKK